MQFPMAQRRGTVGREACLRGCKPPPAGIRRARIQAVRSHASRVIATVEITRTNPRGDATLGLSKAFLSAAAAWRLHNRR